MSNRHVRFTKHYSNNHTERAGGRVDMGPPPSSSLKSPISVAKALAGSARKGEWEQSLPCPCGSGKAILKRAKVAGKWVGYCKKCDPTKVKL